MEVFSNGPTLMNVQYLFYEIVRKISPYKDFLSNGAIFQLVGWIWWLSNTYLMKFRDKLNSWVFFSRWACHFCSNHTRDKTAFHICSFKRVCKSGCKRVIIPRNQYPQRAPNIRNLKRMRFDNTWRDEIPYKKYCDKEIKEFQLKKKSTCEICKHEFTSIG